ncbi:MAG: hypothetical protein DME87_03375 [Verrucomicrobia bacterium]|nr:MAG: hypothetical protein DME87_03375 [Verrucomicrobiota bacterium]
MLKQAAALLEAGEAQIAGDSAAGFAQSRAILYLDRAVPLQAAAVMAASQCERSLFFGRLGRPSWGGINVRDFARKTGRCHLLSSFLPKKICLFETIGF